MDIAEITGLTAGCAGQLTQSESLRMARFRKPEDALRFATGRLMLRQALALELGCAPEDAEVTLSARGKPECAAADALSFNIAHSGSHVLLALGRPFAAGRIGIDVEHMRPLSNYDALARRMFTAKAIDEVAAVSGSAQQACFYRHWVRLEAGLKALGHGLAANPAELSALEGLHYQPIAIAADYAACLATTQAVKDFNLQHLRQASARRSGGAKEQVAA